MDFLKRAMEENEKAIQLTLQLTIDGRLNELARILYHQYRVSFLIVGEMLQSSNLTDVKRRELEDEEERLNIEKEKYNNIIRSLN